VISFILLFICVFVPAALLVQNNFERMEIRDAICLSAKALAGSLKHTAGNYRLIAEGKLNDGNSEIEIDKERLLQEFYSTLKLNILNDKKFEQLVAAMKIKILVYSDRFYVADSMDRWSAPYFFTVEKDGLIFYLFNSSTKAYYYNDSGDKIYADIQDIGISKEHKNSIIIDKLNAVVNEFTYSYEDKNRFSIKILNPESNDIMYLKEYAMFNVLDGITFFVVCTDSKNTVIREKGIKYKNYNVIGYTIDMD